MYHGVRPSRRATDKDVAGLKSRGVRGEGPGAGTRLTTHHGPRFSSVDEIGRRGVVSAIPAALTRCPLQMDSCTDVGSKEKARVGGGISALLR